MANVDGELAAIVRARVGTALCGGKYTIDGVLGIGGMAAVYSGTHRNGRPIAIKLLHPELSRQANIRRRFLREGQAANAVQHPGVVAVIDDDVAEDGAAFVVMERLEGKTLDELWEELGRSFPPRAVLAIGRELCGILAAAHRSGIIHRDLKPENLFLTNDGELKVLDFGLAQLRDAARSPTETQTGMGLVLGTPAFMPPEQASGENSKIDARTDVWAVGATMFTLLSGQHVHDGESPQHFVMLAATAPARSLAAAMPAAPAALVALVDRALAREKEQRWQSAESMREAIVSLSELLLGEPAPPLMTPLALQEAAAPRRAQTSPQAASYFEDSTLAGMKVTPVADLTDETLDDNHPDDHTVTERARAAPRSSDDSSDSADDRTRVGVPDFTLSSDGSDTEPNVAATAGAALEKLPRLGGGSGDASSEDSSEDDAMQVRPVRAYAVEDAKSGDSGEGSDETSTRTETSPAPMDEPSSDRIKKLRSGVRPSAHHRVARPSAPSRTSLAIPPDRASSPAPSPVPRTAEMTSRAQGPRAGTIPYLPIVLAAIFVAVSPLAYFAARGCGRVTPSEEQTVPLTAPSSPPMTPSITSSSSPKVSPPTSQITAEPAPTSNVVASNSSAASAAPPTSTSPPLVVPPDPSRAPPSQAPAGSHSLPEAPDAGEITPSP